MRRKFGNITWYNVEIAYLTKPICLYISSPTILGGYTMSNVRCIIAMMPNRKKGNDILTHFNSEIVEPINWPMFTKEIRNKTMQLKWVEGTDHYELKDFGTWLTISVKFEVKPYHVWPINELGKIAYLWMKDEMFFLL